jgi:predicted  nucleic acid-binding Zn-ribbon protein
MQDQFWFIIIGVGGFALSQLFSIFKDRTRSHEDKLTTTNLLIMEHKTKIAIIEENLKTIEKLKKDIDAAFTAIRDLNKEQVEIYEQNVKLKKEIDEIYQAHVSP